VAQGRVRATLALSGAALVVVAWAAACSAAEHPDVPRVEAMVTEGTNAFRGELGLPAVLHERVLEETARSFAAFMARTGKFDHDADGSSPAERAKHHGYDYCVVAENIARQYSSRGFATAQLARDLLEGWKHSPGHRRNMADPAVTQIGVAIAHRTHDGYEDYYAVQLFGRPRSQSVQFEVRNEARVAVRYRVGERDFVLEPRHARTHTECSAPQLDFEAPLRARFTAARGDRFLATEKWGQITLGRAK